MYFFQELNVVSFERKLNESYKWKKILQITTERPDNRDYDGIVVCIAGEFIILAQEVDYVFDGYVIIPRNKIAYFEEREEQEFSYQLLLDSGAIKRLNPEKWIAECRTYKDIFTHLLQTNRWLSVNWICPRCDEIHIDTAYLKDSDNQSLSVELYNRAGQSQGEMGWVVSKIFSIEFNSGYTDKFGYFLDKRKEQGVAKNNDGHSNS